MYDRNVTPFTLRLSKALEINLSRAPVSELLILRFRILIKHKSHTVFFGWLDSATILGKLPVPGRPTIWMIVGQGLTALAIGAEGGLFGHIYSPKAIFSLIFLPLSGRRPD